MLHVCYLHALPFGSGCEQQGGTGWEERVNREHLPGLEVTASQGGPSNLRSPHTFHLHLAQGIPSLGKLREPAMGVFSSRKGTRTSLALHLGKAFGAQRCLLPAAKPSRHGGFTLWPAGLAHSHWSHQPVLVSGAIDPCVIPYPPPPFYQSSLEKVTGGLSSHPVSSQALLFLSLVSHNGW